MMMAEDFSAIRSGIRRFREQAPATKENRQQLSKDAFWWVDKDDQEISFNEYNGKESNLVKISNISNNSASESPPSAPSSPESDFGKKFSPPNSFSSMASSELSDLLDNYGEIDNFAPTDTCSSINMEAIDIRADELLKKCDMLMQSYDNSNMKNILQSARDITKFNDLSSNISIPNHIKKDTNDDKQYSNDTSIQSMNWKRKDLSHSSPQTNIPNIPSPTNDDVELELEQSDDDDDDGQHWSASMEADILALQLRLHRGGGKKKKKKGILVSGDRNKSHSHSLPLAPSLIPEIAAKESSSYVKVNKINGNENDENIPMATDGNKNGNGNSIKNDTDGSRAPPLPPLLSSLSSSSTTTLSKDRSDTISSTEHHSMSNDRSPPNQNQLPFTTTASTNTNTKTAVMTTAILDSHKHNHSRNDHVDEVDDDDSLLLQAYRLRAEELPPLTLPLPLPLPLSIQTHYEPPLRMTSTTTHDHRNNHNHDHATSSHINSNDNTETTISQECHTGTSSSSLQFSLSPFSSSVITEKEKEKTEGFFGPKKQMTTKASATDDDSGDGDDDGVTTGRVGRKENSSSSESFYISEDGGHYIHKELEPGLTLTPLTESDVALYLHDEVVGSLWKRLGNVRQQLQARGVVLHPPS